MRISSHRCFFTLSLLFSPMFQVVKLRCSLLYLVISILIIKKYMFHATARRGLKNSCYCYLLVQKNYQNITLKLIIISLNYLAGFLKLLCYFRVFNTRNIELICYIICARKPIAQCFCPCKTSYFIQRMAISSN